MGFRLAEAHYQPYKEVIDCGHLMLVIGAGWKSPLMEVQLSECAWTWKKTPHAYGGNICMSDTKLNIQNGSKLGIYKVSCHPGPWRSYPCQSRSEAVTICFR